MSILIPQPTPAAPYPLVNDALNLARTRINDAIQSIGGEMLTNVQPYSQVMVNAAWLRFQKFMAGLGYSRARKRVVLTGLPIVNSQDPASECTLNWSYFFDGVSFWVPPNTPVLPQDLLCPLEVRERQSSTQFSASGYQPVLTAGSRGFSRMQLVAIGENPNWRKRPWNGCWDWRNDEIVIPGSTSPMDFEIYYSASLQQFNTVGQIPWWQQPIPIVQGESALAFWICYEFSLGRGDMDSASWLTQAQQDARELVNSTEVPLRQRFNVSRRSYGGRGQGGGNTGSFGYGGL